MLGNLQAGRLLKFLISLSYLALQRTHDLFSRFALARQRPRFVVLMYHGVSSKERARFAQQMDDLIRFANPCSIASIGRTAEPGLHVAVTFDDGFRGVLENAVPELVKRNIPAAVFFPSSYLGKRPGWIKNFDDSDRARWVMTAEDAKRLPNDLITIGSHTMTHRDLSQLDEDEARKELSGSKKALEDLFEREIDCLAFPYGEFSSHTIESAKEAGYRRVFSAIPTDPISFLVGRIDVTPNDWTYEFRLKLRGSYCWLPAAITVKKAFFDLLPRNWAILK